MEDLELGQSLGLLLGFYLEVVLVSLDLRTAAADHESEARIQEKKDPPEAFFATRLTHNHKNS